MSFVMSVRDVRRTFLENDMEYMILIYADEQLYADMPQAELAAIMADYGRYEQELIAAGVLRAGSELAPVHAATTVRLRDGKLLCSDGPFAETKEQLGGYFVIACDNLDEAIKWAARCPSAGHGSIELRPLANTA
jgi:hypothetical protein